MILTRNIENGEDKYLSHRVVQSPCKEFQEWYAKAGYSTNASAGQWAMWEAWQAGRALSAITNTRRGKSDPSSGERQEHARGEKGEPMKKKLESLCSVACLVLLAVCVSLCMFGDGVLKVSSKLLYNRQPCGKLGISSHLDPEELSIHLCVITHPCVISKQPVRI